MYYRILENTDTYDAIVSYFDQLKEVQKKRRAYLEDICNKNNINLRTVSVISNGSVVLGIKSDVNLEYFKYSKTFDCQIPNYKTKEGRKINKELKSLVEPCRYKLDRIIFGEVLWRDSRIYVPLIEMIEKTIIITIDHLGWNDVVPKDSELITNKEYHCLKMKAA